MHFRHPEKSSGGALGLAVALLPILEGAEADADQRGELRLGETQFLTDGESVGPMELVLAAGRDFAAQDGPAFTEAGGKFFEEFVFHG